jgi:hypothetical protein
MEIIKKTILQALTTGTTVTGGTIIIPDLSAMYYMKIGLKQDTRDVGFLDAYIEPPEPPIPPEPPTVTNYYIEYNNDVFIDGNGDEFVWE